ncbi:MAG: hypothetical protein SGCHY_000390 [Lobulomycetales sp.]
MTVPKLTIFVCGPKMAGKTAIANVLADVSGSLSTEYHPTQAVRILEFESKVAGEKFPVAIELWDCSGDPNFWSHVSATSSYATSVLLVQSKKGQEKDLETIYESTFSFMSSEKIHIFAHGGEISSRPKYSVGALQKAAISYTSMDDQDSIRTAFKDLVNSTYKAYVAQKEDEEGSLLG